MDVTTLAQQITADVGTSFLDASAGFAVQVTLPDLSTIDGILLDSFGEVPDPRAPQLFVADADVSALSHGAALTINSISYTIEGYQPDGFGGAVLQLTQL